MLICQPETSRRVLDRYPDFPERQIISGPLPDDDRGLSELLRQVDTNLPPMARLRFREDV